MNPATTVDEYNAIEISSKDFVRSPNSWTEIRASKKGILSKISNPALDEFESSMGFCKTTGCLLRANCTQISQELGKDLPQFFELFGIAPSLLGKYYPYKCLSL